MLICFDIGGSAIKCAVASGAGQLGAVRRVPTPQGDFGAFAATMQALIDSAAAPGQARGVAISIAGVIDPATGRIRCANIGCIDGRTLAADLAAHFGLPVWIANDADCFVIAEAHAGAARGHANVFGLILGTGVGGGIVLGGRLLTGAGGFAGEWGHGPVAAHYAGTPPAAIPRFPCGCGQHGCLDTVGGARGLERLHGALHPADAANANANAAPPDSRAIVAAWQRGDAAASRTIDCYSDLLAGPLAMLVNTLGVTILPVGGGLSNSAPLIALLDRKVRAGILRHSDTALLVPAGCAIEPGLIGAAKMGRDALAASAGA